MFIYIVFGPIRICDSARCLHISLPNQKYRGTENIHNIRNVCAQPEDLLRWIGTVAYEEDRANSKLVYYELDQNTYPSDIETQAKLKSETISVRMRKMNVLTFHLVWPNLIYPSLCAHVQFLDQFNIVGTTERIDDLWKYICRCSARILLLLFRLSSFLFLFCTTAPSLCTLNRNPPAYTFPCFCDRAYVAVVCFITRTFDLNENIYNSARFHKKPVNKPGDDSVVPCEDLSSTVLNPTRKRVDEAVHEKLIRDNEALSHQYNPIAFALFEKYSKQFDEQYRQWVESEYSIIF